MKKFRLKDGLDAVEFHILEGILPGREIYKGGLSFHKPGERSHSHPESPELDFHVHEDCEAFLIVQGYGTMEIGKATYPAAPGDIFIVEPGEDHHLVSSMDRPVATLWCHAR